MLLYLCRCFQELVIAYRAWRELHRHLQVKQVEQPDLFPCNGSPLILILKQDFEIQSGCFFRITDLIQDHSKRFSHLEQISFEQESGIWVLSAHKVGLYSMNSEVLGHQLPRRWALGWLSPVQLWYTLSCGTASHLGPSFTLSNLLQPWLAKDHSANICCVPRAGLCWFAPM